jgi:hypothetical protein
MDIVYTSRYLLAIFSGILVFLLPLMIVSNNLFITIFYLLHIVSIINTYTYLIDLHSFPRGIDKLLFINADLQARKRYMNRMIGIIGRTYGYYSFLLLITVAVFYGSSFTYILSSLWLILVYVILGLTITSFLLILMMILRDRVLILTILSIIESIILYILIMFYKSILVYNIQLLIIALPILVVLLGILLRCYKWI